MGALGDLRFAAEYHQVVRRRAQAGAGRVGDAGQKRFRQNRIWRPLSSPGQAASLLLQAVRAGWQIKSETGRAQGGGGGSDERARVSAGRAGRKVRTLEA